MPFRRLPASDAAINDALRAIYAKVQDAAPESLPVSAETLARVNDMYPKFNKEVGERGAALSVQSDATKKKYAAADICKTYVSQFIQVFNFGITRGRYNVSERGYYQLDINQETVPDLSSESNILTAAENIIKGDKARVAAGGAEMINPSAEEVEEKYKILMDAIKEQSDDKDIYEKEQRDVDNLRAEALETVKDVWDEIEFNLRKNKPSVMRRKAREYGVVYALRPGEPEEEPPVEEETT